MWCLRTFIPIVVHVRRSFIKKNANDIQYFKEPVFCVYRSILNVAYYRKYTAYAFITFYFEKYFNNYKTINYKYFLKL